MKFLNIILISHFTIPSLCFTPTSNIDITKNLFFQHQTQTVLFSNQPPYWGSNNYRQGNQQPQDQNNEGGDINNDDETLKGNRWSKFAPDASLPTEQFREQLRANMKADLERRRREDPNRGNQPAKSYLDSL